MKGSIIKRGNKWSVVLEGERDTDGKRQRHWHSGYSTQQEAEEAHVELLAAMQQGVYSEPNKVTVGEWLTEWLEGRQTIADTTRDGYRMEVRRITQALGSRKLRDLTPRLISGFYRSLDLAPKTIKNCHGVFHKALEDAVR